ncbi:bifunctional adenosylcobinamide kinase/adenosylcobinamide-phosphate guanylyltransferase [Undibacterium sp. CY18W]|uniref:Bifunctional adenosylcobalamin biosynthesis protein n=1 Tax=Undibacterium hunanense TaxID=2762292 RepID=A0ABR6ZUP6_9BURK|nr:bifunctional adenosylcobinamide kinase/adenosylcobinamide-phosphate guanylyltransferase [Undibacterium hunanense]MBC3919606.1 bifunctional adenosylcobinamide kinase/adenosylcobinamide-phosphate guanylyltransferase [Undibacterium hunanense]
MNSAHRASLIFGGARSGKSAFAEQLATRLSKDQKEILYLATAKAGDAEMQERIAHHRTRRPAHWGTLEQGLELGATIMAHSRADNIILVDCLTVWLSNLLFSESTDFPEIGHITPPPQFAVQRQALLDALVQAPGQIILVSNEVGMGIVPMGAVSRWFVDEAGRLNQAVAAIADNVVWVAAGLPLYFKGQPC